MAVAASMLTATSYIPQRHAPSQALGGDYFERRDKTKVATRLIQRLTDPGLHVEVRSATELFLSSQQVEHIHKDTRGAY
jgi:hypothetical protein